MASTYLQLQEKVNRRIIDLPAAVTAEVPLLVNYGKKRVQEEYNFRAMEAEQSENTTLNTRDLAAVPSNFKEHRGHPYFVQSAGKAVDIGIGTSRQNLLRAMENDATGYPKFLLRDEPSDVLGASVWECWPLPDGNSDWTTAPAGEYRVRIPYWKFLPDFTANGDTDWFSTNAEWAIVFFATAQGFALDWDAENETRYIAKALEEIEKVKKFDKIARLAGHETFVPHHSGARAPGLTWR